MTPDDLGLVPTMTLVDELVRRFDVTVFIARAHAPHGNDWQVTRRFEGDYDVAMGLAAQMVIKINAAREEDSRPAEPTEESI